jgi:hypothetical protein
MRRRKFVEGIAQSVIAIGVSSFKLFYFQAVLIPASRCGRSGITARLGGG